MTKLYSETDTAAIKQALRVKGVRQYRNAEEVAKVLEVINPHGYTADHLISVADSEFHKDNNVTFMGTGGWYVTFYPVADDVYTHEAVFTLMPYAVDKYLEANKLY